MLSEFFSESARMYALRRGPSGPLLEDFADYLFQSGYAKISARRHIRSAEHIVHWALRRGLSVDGLMDWMDLLSSASASISADADAGGFTVRLE
jgi:hypothetical protein